MFKLRADTPPEWAVYVADHLDQFLIDHAACERKASANAMHFVVRYPDRADIVDAMVEVAREELEHFHDVFHLMQERGVELAADEKDPYVNALLKKSHKKGEKRLLDRLLLGSIIEYRGCERFAMLSRELAKRPDDAALAEFYKELAASESKHRGDFYELALNHFDRDDVEARLDFWLDLEGQIVDELPIRAALH
ncbi:tRNA-(ms[2]io[6]A)-hydroxylase [Persicimonas caeni]|jgi:tRNA-(ms[2]io[6]A)-hydroxylase|uniref:tRNA-(Ms[2]io[6]A)-hydroxylase n=1 Tax=Persicimonas caeni TaxID=2292766 RepID=A0A4Y6PSF8_PERCE|nr:tRNA-(ms[2]io[6]A)-hydroxylase [Persicimonas caeni]QDG51049.1 tRNA-(ms[2]io[6]A)-hydroxylase [Persicimonas caeni]QED32270.1 tRNA-(ms[2]io[6]A)-hydroxylase [Persicimonas caeni]